MLVGEGRDWVGWGGDWIGEDRDLVCCRKGDEGRDLGCGMEWGNGGNR